MRGTAVRNAGAAKIEVTGDEGKVTVLIQDDRRGFDLGRVTECHGMGLN
jgi:signal transduction histidine kinase